MFKRSILVLVLLAITAFTGCTSGKKLPNGPKARLQQYISESFDAKSLDDKAKLLSYLTGDAKIRLAGWSDDQFREAFIDSKRQFLKLVYENIKKISPTETDITYELSYLNKARGSTVKVTNKKMSQMVLKDGKWMIRDVHDIRELIEYQDEMSLP